MNTWKVINLHNLLKPECVEILKDPSKWSKKYMMTSCALCHKPFDDDEVPLHMWKDGGRQSISFCVKCAFGEEDKAVPLK